MDILKKVAKLLATFVLILSPIGVRAQGGQATIARFGATLPTCNAATRWQIFTKTGTNSGFYVCLLDNNWHGYGAGATNQIGVYGGAGTILIGDTLFTDNGTTLSYTGAGGMSAASFTATNASVSGGLGFGQGPSNVAGQCNAVNCIGWQAPVTVSTNGWYTLPPGPTPGVMHFGAAVSGVVPGSTSGDASHSSLLTNQTASIGTTNLCPASAGGCNSTGQYIVLWSIRSSLACATPGPAGVTLTLGWTDDVGAKTFIVPQTGTGSSGTSVALGNTVNFGHGSFTINSTGAAAITYTTTLAACTTGTATYNIQLSTIQTD